MAIARSHSDLTYREKIKLVNTRAAAMHNDPTFKIASAHLCFFFGLFGIAGWGIFIALPYIYSDVRYWVNVTRAFGCFLVFQILVNWICMKFVSTFYQPSEHGTKPERLDIGQNISETCSDDDQINNAAIRSKTFSKNRKDATAIPMKTGSVMYVATEMPKADESLKRTAFQYFSWTPCLQCNRLRPPRCHHCPLCNACVLKRDHHCYFTGTCIGYRNLRHFSVFIFWAVVATLFAMIHALMYAYYDILPHVRCFDFLFPISIIRSMLGFIDVKFSVCIVLGWILLVYLIWSCLFFNQVCSWIVQGMTSFEIESNMAVHDTRDLRGKLQAVYGNYWLLNFLIPLHFVFEPIDDPVRWPSYIA